MARIGDDYHCPFDNTIVVHEEVDKSIIKKKGIPGKIAVSSEEMYHKLIGSSKDKRAQILDNRSLTRKNSSITAYHHSKISELNDIEGLSPKLLLEVARLFESKNIKKYSKINTRKEFLSRIGHDNEKIIDFLYSTLFLLEEIPNALKIRFSVFAPTIIKGEYTITMVNPSQGCDIVFTDEHKNETWIYVTDEVLDLHNIDEITKRATQVNFKDHPFVRNICFVSKKFSYVARGMIKKHQSAFTGIEEIKSDGIPDVTRSIPLTIWEPNPRDLSFKNVSLE
ncbi:MAG: hypothetical protein ACXAB2_00720 [Candidatus Hodarchaeales archaeon]